MRLATATAWVILPILAGAGLYMLKMQVEAQEQRLAGIQRQIVDARQAIHVLKAEWSYLNDPVRLRDQAERLLGMRPVLPSQIVAIDRIPFADPAMPTVSSAPTPAPKQLARNKPSNDAIAAAIAAFTDPPRSNVR